MQGRVDPTTPNVLDCVRSKFYTIEATMDNHEIDTDEQLDEKVERVKQIIDALRKQMEDQRQAA